MFPSEENIIFYYVKSKEKEWRLIADFLYCLVGQPVKTIRKHRKACDFALMQTDIQALDIFPQGIHIQYLYSIHTDRTHVHA